MTDLAELQQSALAAVREAGLHFDEIRPNAGFQRARKPFDAEWLIADSGTTAAGTQWLAVSAGDFRESGGASEALVTWRSWSRDLPKAEREEISAQRETTKRRVEAELTEKHELAAERIRRRWADLKPGPHPYLSAKRLDYADVFTLPSREWPTLKNGKIPGHTSAERRLPRLNVRVSGEKLVIPIFAVSGEMISAQLVFPSGARQFVEGSSAAGGYHPVGFLGRRDQPSVWLAEGFADAAALHVYGGVPAASAMFAANLPRVAKALRRDLPDLDIVVAADNDEVGLKRAQAAVEVCGGCLWIPPEPGDDPWTHLVEKGGTL
jgi:phage/plasmid primase-like uncharacterized protein